MEIKTETKAGTPVIITGIACKPERRMMFTAFVSRKQGSYDTVLASTGLLQPRDVTDKEALALFENVIWADTPLTENPDDQVESG